VGVAPGTIDEDQWLPKSLFRVWQVTMEFLVNPYPYLSYKYLKEKSSAAKTLEEDLLKNDITPRNVEESYRRYLHATLQTANLEIVSSFVDDIDTDNDNKTTLMHVIGKSRSAPHNYFYCIKNEQDRWTPWEKIDVAIKENDADGKGASGAHVMFTKFRDRYYLIMPEFVKRQKNELPTLTSGKSLTPNNLATENLSAFAAKPFWEIKIAVSEYYNKKWSPKQYLKTVLDEDDVFDTLYSEDVSKYIFTFEPGTDSSLLFHIRMKGSTIRTEFEFRGVNASVLVSKKSNLSVKADVSFQNFVFRELRFPVDNVVDQPLIFKEARKHKLINTPYPGSDLATAYVSPFFFHDQDRTYFATSQPITYDLQEAQVVDRPPLTRNPREYQVKLIAHPETFAFLPSLSLTASKMLIKRTGI
ncbi:MAG: neuraminidase-like domain-containing protein, partial [Bacteroidota bacterium]